MPKHTFVILDELECGFLILSKFGISLCGAGLLGAVFLLGIATSESIAIYIGGLEGEGHLWSMVDAYISFACVLLIFVVLGILEIRNLLIAPIVIRELRISKMEEAVDNEASDMNDLNYIYDTDGNAYRVCKELFHLLEGGDIIEAEIKRMRILKVHYIHRFADE